MLRKKGPLGKCLGFSPTSSYHGKYQCFSCACTASSSPSNSHPSSQLLIDTPRIWKKSLLHMLTRQTLTSHARISSGKFLPRLHMSTGTAKRWPFTPLKPSAAGQHGRKLEGVVFDVDGTLCLPQNYMFREMRSALGIPKSVDILGHISSLASEEAARAHKAIRDIERNAMSKQTPQPGLQELMSYLDQRGIRKGICTRNFDEPVNHLLRKFLVATSTERPQDGLHDGLRAFAPILTRSFTPPKPSPAPLLHIAEQWGLIPSGSLAKVDRRTEAAYEDTTTPSGNIHELHPTSHDSPAPPPDQRCNNVIMVGDSIDDVLAGKRAGCVTIVLQSEDGAGQNPEVVEMADFSVRRLDEIIHLLEQGMVPNI